MYNLQIDVTYDKSKTITLLLQITIIESWDEIGTLQFKRSKVI